MYDKSIQTDHIDKEPRLYLQNEVQSRWHNGKRIKWQEACYANSSFQCLRLCFHMMESLNLLRIYFEMIQDQ